MNKLIKDIWEITCNIYPVINTYMKSLIAVSILRMVDKTGNILVTRATAIVSLVWVLQPTIQRLIDRSKRQDNE